MDHGLGRWPARLSRRRAKVITALCVLNRDAGAAALPTEHWTMLSALFTDPGSVR
ncbi:hypothetical protein AB0D13_40345 [Streptomyces sp. NPDC048430]|uniref:hypothetical protein n=1 Tax=unclassified Streptomyces TaxID=2593676 RepID=UPI00341AAB82